MDSHIILVMIKGKDETEHIADIKQEAAFTQVPYLNGVCPCGEIQISIISDNQDICHGFYLNLQHTK